MAITSDFSALWNEVKKVSNQIADFEISKELEPFDPIDVALEEGKEVDINMVDFDGPVASYMGRQVLLYIPDHGSRVDEVIAGRVDGKKFHVTDCKTLNQMRRNNRFERYFATNDFSGEFNIFGQSYYSSEKSTGKARLRVCKNCMSRLNYKGYRTEVRAKDAFVNNFSIPEFFESFSSYFRTMPRGLKFDDGDYTDDWKEIASQLKLEKGYICEECNIDLSESKRLLHVHHINGVKSDNLRNNLRVLCADCHRRQPYHQHMHISHSDMQLINRLRRKSGMQSDDWNEVLQYVDPAANGALALLRKKGYGPPVIGYPIQNCNQEIIAEPEAAWPDKKFALVLSCDQVKDIPGWKFKTIAQIHYENE